MLVEFALSAVVFFMLLFGTCTFGLGVWEYNMVSNLAQEGARWAAVHGPDSVSPATAADVQTFVQGRGLGLTLTATTSTADATTRTCNTTSANPSAMSSGTGVCVKVQTSFAPMTMLWSGAAWNLQSTAQMVMSR